MSRKTFVEKVLNSDSGSIVFRKPDIVLSHDNTASILKTFEKMGGDRIANPSGLLVVLDHNAPPTNAKLANDYQSIRDFVKYQNIESFHDVGSGICHQIMSSYAKPGMVIVGSDSHTCTAGAFNALSAGIDRTETAGIWRKEDTWFRVPETIKINLEGRLAEGVFAKDLSLWIIGVLGSAGANYLSIEFHGDGVKNLSISDRMTLANLASEMGAKNAVFPADKVLANYFGKSEMKGVWADDDAEYQKEIEIDLSIIYPLVAAPHQVDNIKAVSEVEGIEIQQGLIGTCTNGRIEDLRIAASVLDGKKVAKGFQLLVVPASKDIYLDAVKEGLITTLITAGATILSSSCGPCLGTGQGIPADGYNIISTANRNFLGRMGNKNASIYLASPATVAMSSIYGKITHPIELESSNKFELSKKKTSTTSISSGDQRRINSVWDYSDIDDMNTDQMFAGNLTYNVLSSDAEAITPHLLKGFDDNFAGHIKANDIIIAGDNFGCGSSREHPAVGLAHAGIKVIIVKSVNRIFYRSAINQGLMIIVNKSIVEKYNHGDKIDVDFVSGKVYVGDNKFDMTPLPDKLMDIIDKKGLVNWMKTIKG